ELEGVDDVAGERGPAADDLLTRIERELGEVVDDPVGAGPGRDLLEAHVVALGQRCPQPVRAAVGIPVQLLSTTRKRFERLGEGPERTLVRRELDDAVEPELTLDLV